MRADCVGLKFNFCRQTNKNTQTLVLHTKYMLSELRASDVGFSRALNFSLRRSEPCHLRMLSFLLFVIVSSGVINSGWPNAIVQQEASMTYGKLAVYTDAMPLFVGGYTVTGNTIAESSLSSFSVEQECLCECNATTTGLFCRGANAENAFFMVVSRDDEEGRWRAQQVSIGIKPAYRASMDFAHVPGGKHTAVGYRLSPTTMPQGQTLFRAQQSEIGCSQGAGARTCKAVCGRFGLPWAQIRDRCSID